MIVERQQRSTWGKGVVITLAGDLRHEFPGISGFSAANLWRMKLFYETYATNAKLAPLVREIAWTHNLPYGEVHGRPGTSVKNCNCWLQKLAGPAQPHHGEVHGRPGTWVRQSRSGRPGTAGR